MEVEAQDSGSEIPDGERLGAGKPADRGETPKEEPVAEVVALVSAERSLTGPGYPNWVSRREGFSEPSASRGGNW